MKFLNHRGYLTPGGTTGAGANYAGGGTGARRAYSNAPGGVAGLTTSQTQIKLGNKSTQVGLSKGPGARARRTGWATRLGGAMGG
jgi:hypothetical protein